jgi:Zn-dependent M28 family amino/carboxypeptidase
MFSDFEYSSHRVQAYRSMQMSRCKFALAAAGWSMLAVWIAAAGAVAQPQSLPDELVRAGTQHITRSLLEAPVRFLASDALEGRAPGSRGDLIARQYLATQLESLGLQPAGVAGGWEQPFAVVAVKAQLPQQWRFQTAGQAVDLQYFTDFGGGSGVQAEVAQIDAAELVFVGFGIQAPEFSWDDFKGTDLKGKVLVMLNNDPDWDPALFAGNKRLYYGRWSYKYESGARQGAAAVIIIHTTPSAGYPWQVIQTSWSGEQLALPAGNEPRIQLKAWVTEPAMRRLLASSGHDLDQLTRAARERDFRPVPLGIKTSIQLRNQISRVTTANVLGLLPGSDPELKKEVVVLSAHHDHLGIRVADLRNPEDKIYNGAVDNATGCAQLLAMARALNALPQKPRRSLLLFFAAAEEQGLLGAHYFAKQPTIAVEKIAANLNFDSANIWGKTRDIVMIDLGKSSLDEVAQQVATMQGRVLKPDAFPDRGYFYRSDHFAFASVGVPALSIDNGVEFIDRPANWGEMQLKAYEAQHYHQPSDELRADWNFDGMIQDAQFGLYMTWLVAQNPQPPQWRPGDEFAGKRAAVAP